MFGFGSEKVWVLACCSVVLEYTEGRGSLGIKAYGKQMVGFV